MRILIDQNVPVAIAEWLRGQRPAWNIEHVKDLGFDGKPDDFLYQWAQSKKAIILTYDEDFADARLYPLGRHAGIIRLRVWPTTIEQTQLALSRLLLEIPDTQWPNSLIIIDNQKTRVRHPGGFI